MKGNGLKIEFGDCWGMTPEFGALIPLESYDPMQQILGRTEVSLSKLEIWHSMLCD